MTRNSKIVKLLCFKGNYDNKCIVLSKLKSREFEEVFTVVVSIIKR